MVLSASTKPIAWAKPEMASLRTSRSLPTAINDHKQGLHANDAEAFGCAHSYPAETSRAGHSGGVLTRAPGLFFRAQVRGCRPVAAQSRPHQCLCQITAGLVHQSSRLSSLPSLDGSETIEKAFGDGRISFGGQQIVFRG